MSWIPRTSLVDLLKPVTADQTSPASNTYQVTTALSGFSAYSAIAFYATITGGTGGPLDVLIEHSPDGVDWYEYVHFTQVSAAAVKTYVAAPAVNAASVNVGKNGLDGSAQGTTMTLTAGTVAGGQWFDKMRVRYVAGTSTSAGATQVVRVLVNRALR
jgi:hypothetical protein